MTKTSELGRVGDNGWEETVEMCQAKKKKGCEQPEKLKDKPEECTPEQVKECHGEVIEHPCVKKE